MLAFLPIISLFGNILVQVVGSLTGLSPTTQTLISSLLPNVTAIIQNLMSAKGTLQDVLASLAGLSSILATLMADPAISADKLKLLETYDDEVQAAILAYVKAGTGYNAATYSPISPVV